MVAVLILTANQGEPAVTPEQIAAQIEALVAAARDAGVDDETIAAALQDAADALHEGLS